jgi:hypothetical protein
MMSIKTFGIYESIQTIKQSKVSDHPQLKYFIKTFESKLASGFPEYAIVKDYAETLKNFTWDNVVATSLSGILESINAREQEIIVRKTVDVLRLDRTGFYKTPANLLENWISNENRSIVELKHSIKNYLYEHRIAGTVNALETIEAKATGSLHMAANAANTVVESIYSPVHTSGNDVIFNVGGNFVKKNKKGIFKLSEKELSELPVDFLNLCKAFFNYATVVAEKVIVRINKKDKLSLSLVNEQKEILLNDNKIAEANLYNTISLVESQGLFNTKTFSMVNIVKILNENLDKIADIDFGKTISSTMYEGLSLSILKTDTGIVVNKINEGMKENSLLKCTGTQAVKIAKAVLNYDLTNTLSSLLEGEMKAKGELVAKGKVVLNNIALLEDELAKVEDAIDGDNELEANDEVVDAKTELQEEIAKMKSLWSEIEMSIQNIEELTGTESVEDEPTEVAPEEGTETQNEPMPEEPATVESVVVIENESPLVVEEETEYNIGDEVEVDGHGKGKITAIADKTFTVMLDSGDSIDVTVNDLISVEPKIEAGIKDNESASDEEKAKNEDAPIELDEDTEEAPTEEAPVDPATEAPKEETVEEPKAPIKASLTIDLGPYKAGEILEIDAISFTQAGENDNVTVVNPIDGIALVPKAYVKISSDDSPIETEEAPVAPEVTEESAPVENEAILEEESEIKDKNGKDIKVEDKVSVDGDGDRHAFDGIVDEIKDGQIIVVDMDGDFFMVEPSQVEVQ